MDAMESQVINRCEQVQTASEMVPNGRSRIFRVGRSSGISLLGILVSALLAGCITHSPDDAPDSYLQPSGWRNNEPLPEVTKHITRMPGFNVKAHVLGLTHTAVHISPNNPHYGAHGDYRNCGGTARRQPELVATCLSTDELWYGLWGQAVEPGRAQGIATFNPNFELLTEGLTSFIESALPGEYRK